MKTSILKSNRPYVKPELENNVITYQFKGSCDSLYYKVVQSPLCDWLVSMMPESWAPNAITLAGFACNIITFLFMTYLYGFSTEGPLDDWFCVLMCFSYFAYSTLDNCDGKQARRTGNGSPMGMLFDHGCDATTAIINNIMLQRMTQIGSYWQGMLCMMISTVPFYYLVLEEFYLGVLMLPMFSGPDDTSLAYYFACLYTAYAGSEALWAAEQNFFGFGTWRLSHFYMCVIAFIEVASVLNGVGTNLWKGRHSEHFEKRYHPLRFVAHTSYMVTLCAVWMSYTLLPGNLMIGKHPRLAMFAYGAQFLQGTLRVLVSGVTQDKEFMPYRRTTLLCWSLLLVNAISLLTSGQGVFDDLVLLLTINLISWSAVGHLIYYTLNELMAILNIKMFKVKPKQSSQKKHN